MELSGESEHEVGLPGIRNHEVAVFHTQNSDVTSWVQYLECSITNARKNASVTCIEDVHFFPELTDWGKHYLSTSDTVIIVISPDLVSYLDEDPTYFVFSHEMKEDMAAILFFCGVNENCSTVEERLSDPSRWTKLVAECDQDHMSQVLNKICELIDGSSAKTQTVSNGSLGKSKSVEERNIDRDKRSRKAVKNLKVAQSNSQGSLLHARPECRIIPDNGPCDQETPVVLVFNEQLPAQVILEVEFEGQDTLDREVLQVERLNPYTFQFNMPAHVCEDVKIKIKSERHLLGTKKFHYTSVFDSVSRITEVLLAMMDTMCKDHETDETFLSGLDNKLKMLFDSSDLPIRAFEKLFTFYETSTKETSTMMIPTLLHFAAKYGLKETAGVLNDLPGAMHAFGVTNANGQDPLDLAVQYNHPDLKDFLEDWRETVQQEEIIYETMWKYSERADESLTQEELDMPVKHKLSRKGSPYLPSIDSCPIDADPHSSGSLPSGSYTYDVPNNVVGEHLYPYEDNYDRPFIVPVPVAGAGDHHDDIYLPMNSSSSSREEVLSSQYSVDIGDLQGVTPGDDTDAPDYIVMRPEPPSPVHSPDRPPPSPQLPPPRPVDPHPINKTKPAVFKLERSDGIDLSSQESHVTEGTLDESGGDADTSTEVDPFPDLVEHGERPPPPSPTAIAEASQRELLEILHQVKDGKMTIQEAEACQQGWQLYYKNRGGFSSFKEKEENMKRLKENYKRVVDHIQTEEPGLSNQPVQKGLFGKLFRWNRGRNKANIRKTSSTQPKPRSMSLTTETSTGLMPDIGRLQIAEELSCKITDPVLDDPVCQSIPDLPDNILTVLEDPPANNRFSTISNSSSSSVIDSETDSQSSNSDYTVMGIDNGGGSFASRASCMSAQDSGIDVCADNITQPIREEDSGKKYASDDSFDPDGAAGAPRVRKIAIVPDVNSNTEEEHSDDYRDGYEMVDNWVDPRAPSVKGKKDVVDGSSRLSKLGDSRPPPVPPRSPRRNSTAVGPCHHPSGLPRPRSSSQPFITPYNKPQPKPVPAPPRPSGIPKASAAPVKKTMAKNYSNVVISLKQHTNFHDKKHRGPASGSVDTGSEVASSAEHELKLADRAPPVPPRNRHT